MTMNNEELAKEWARVHHERCLSLSDNENLIKQYKKSRALYERYAPWKREDTPPPCVFAMDYTNPMERTLRMIDKALALKQEEAVLKEIKKMMYLKPGTGEPVEMKMDVTMFDDISLKDIASIIKVNPFIVKVIFNDPATIVFWSDGTKTVVAKQKEDKNKKFDKEKGLAMAIAKKYLGNEGSYFNEFKKWCE